MVLGTAVAGLTCLADVTSANVVGYQSQTLVKGKYNMIVLPFAGLNSDGTSKLSECMTGSNWFGHDDLAQADNIMVYNPQTTAYTTYYWWEDDSHTEDGWYNEDGVTLFDDFPENEGGLDAGWAVWYLSRGDKAPSVTFSGAVAGADDFSIQIQGGCYNMIANPYPSAFQPNSDQPWWEKGEKQVDWNGPVANDDLAQADNIMIWVPSTGEYNTYYYWADDSHESDGWYYENGVDLLEDDPDHPEMANGIASGRVFWYLSRAEKKTSRNIKFFSPIAK